MLPVSPAGALRHSDALYDHLPAGVVVHGADVLFVRLARRVPVRLVGQHRQARDAAVAGDRFVQLGRLQRRRARIGVVALPFATSCSVWVSSALRESPTIGKAALSMMP